MSTGPFGRQRGRPFDPEEIPWDQIIKWVPLALVLLLVLFFGTSMFYRVEANQQGVVLQFGKHRETVQPGLHWKLPWPIEKIYRVPVQLTQSLEFGFRTTQAGRVTQFSRSKDDMEVAEMLTGDLNLGHIEWIVQYSIDDPVKFLFSIGSTEAIVGRALPSGENYDPNPAVPDTIRDVAESVMRKLVGDLSIDSVLTLGRDKLATDAAKMIQLELDSFDAGIDIITVELQTTSPPTAEVQDAFQEVNRAMQKKDRVLNEALGERKSLIPEAEGTRDKAILEAEGYKLQVVLEATGRTKAFKLQLDEYKKDPEITRKRLYLEAMEEILAKVGSKTIIDDSVRGVLPLLNLDRGTSLPAGKKGARR